MTGNKIEIATLAIQHLLYTLNEEDNVNIVTFAGAMEKKVIDYKFLEPCFKLPTNMPIDNILDENGEEPLVQEEGILVPATKANKNMLIKKLQNIVPVGKSDLEVVKEAIEIFANIRDKNSGRSSIQFGEKPDGTFDTSKEITKTLPRPPATIVIVTDAFQDMQDGDLVDTSKIKKSDYSIYTFLVGSQLDTGSASAEKLTCQYGGKSFELTSPSNLVRHIIDFLQSLHDRGFAHDLDSDDRPKDNYWYSNSNGMWTSPYPSRVIGYNQEKNQNNNMAVKDEWVMTVSLPVESKLETQIMVGPPGRKIDLVSQEPKDGRSKPKDTYNQLIGVVGIELSMQDIYEIIKPYKLGPSGYIIIYKRISGRIILHPALRTAVILEDAEFISDGIYELKVSELEPDLFQYNQGTNKVKLKENILPNTFTDVPVHNIPLDALGKYITKSSKVKDVEIPNSPFNVMFVFDVTSDGMSSNTPDKTNIQNNSNFTNDKLISYPRSIFQNLIKNWYGKTTCNNRRDVMTSETYNYDYTMCTLYNLLDAELTERSNRKSTASGLYGQNGASTIDSNMPSTGSTMELVNKWQFCIFKDEQERRDKSNPECPGDNYKDQVQMIKNYLESKSARSDSFCDEDWIHRLALEAAATSVFPGKAADKSKESMNSQDTSQYKTEGRVRMVGLEELFVVTSTGLKRSYNLLPTNKKSKAFWNLEMNSFSEARYPLYYQHQFYSNDVQFNWYPRTDIVLVTRNLVTQSVPESGANQNNVNRNKKQATKNNPIPYGIIGALVNRQQFLQHMDNMLDEYINKNSQNEKLDCDIVNCYLITTDGRMLGTLKAKDSKYLRRNEPLEKFVNDRLDTVDSELWKFLIDDGYFVRKTPDKQMKDNQGMCMLRYQDEIIDNGQKKQNSIIAGKNKETQKVKLSWELTNLEQSQVKYWHPWQARSDPNYIEAFNQYFRCTQTVNEYTFDQSKLNAKGQPQQFKCAF